MNFYNQPVQDIFNGFFTPYNALSGGSSCGFITTSMNGIVDIACNQFVPYINITSALSITESVFVFILFVLAYFLTTRFQFYEFLDGDFNNFGTESFNAKAMQQKY